MMGVRDREDRPSTQVREERLDGMHEREREGER